MDRWKKFAIALLTTFVVIVLGVVIAFPGIFDMKPRVASTDSTSTGYQPSEVWMEGVRILAEAEKLESHGRKKEAVAKYQMVKSQVRWVAEFHPSFHPEIVRAKEAELNRRISNAQLAYNY